MREKDVIPCIIPITEDLQISKDDRFFLFDVNLVWKPIIFEEIKT